MPKFSEFAASATLIVFTQFVTLASAPGVSATSELSNQAVPIISQQRYATDVPIEVSTAPIKGKQTERLIPASLIQLAQADAKRPPLNQNGQSHRGGPPIEAIEACVGKEDAASCAIEDRNGQLVEGICKVGPRGEAAACMPPRERALQKRN